MVDLVRFIIGTHLTIIQSQLTNKIINMKKFTLLLASAAVASSAVAAEPALARRSNILNASVSEKQCNVTYQDASVALKINDRYAAPAVRRAAGDGVLSAKYIAPFQNVLYTGMTETNSSTQGTIGIAGIKGSLSFVNKSTGASGCSWGYADLSSNDSIVVSDQDNLVINAVPGGGFMTPYLTAQKGSEESVYNFVSNAAYLWGGDQTVLGWPEEVGLTAYPYTGKAPNDPQSVYSTTVYFGYDLNNPEYFDENGTCKFWYDLLKEFENGATVSDIKVNGFVSVLPAMSSSYMITKTWAWVNGSVSEATELTVSLHKIEDGIMQESPMAIGRAAVERGAFSKCITYDIVPVDEDGDEIEGDVVIDTPVALMFNVADNPAIQKFSPVMGIKSEVPSNDTKNFNQYVGICAYIDMSYAVNGEYKQSLEAFPGFYPGMTDDTSWFPGYYTVMVDAVFPYVLNVANGSASDFSVSVPNAGGEGSIEVAPYYYMLAACVEEGWITAESSEDWFTFDISEPDATTGVSTITVEAEALPEGVEGRVGTIEFHGMAQDFTITVHQGANASINDIVAGGNNAAVEYFDIQGRRLNAAPATGLFFQRQGNTVTKIVK